MHASVGVQGRHSVGNIDITKTVVFEANLSTQPEYAHEIYVTANRST